ncbi:MAG TPA: RsmE family RNA methyltransferase [Actinomycetota bacterium]|nr:RsmE family RNA methyltransferase [Actinomycetota bacterium]
MKDGPWFIAPPEAWSDADVTLDPAESHHALRVLRVAPPDVITVTDGRGNVARCAVKGPVGERLVAEILEREARRRTKPQVVVYQGAAKSGKLDDVVERLAELGVAEMWAYASERSVARWDATKAGKLDERWAGVARSAAKQARSPFLLQARAGLSWTELVERVREEPLAITLWEEASLPLRTALAEQAGRVALVVGPEGGLTRTEAEALADAGAPLVSLGPRILRTENAPVVAVSALLFHYGLIG